MIIIYTSVCPAVFIKPHHVIPMIGGKAAGRRTFIFQWTGILWYR